MLCPTGRRKGLTRGALAGGHGRQLHALYGASLGFVLLGWAGPVHGSMAPCLAMSADCVGLKVVWDGLEVTG